MNSKNAGVAAVLSFVFPGLGFIYLGKIRTAFSYLFGVPFICLMGFAYASGSTYHNNQDNLISLLFILISLLVWIKGIYVSYNLAHTLNEQGTKKCQFCAERISIEAIICRFCGKEA